MKIGDLETHPYADACPLLAGVEFPEKSCDDIKKNGLLDSKLYAFKGQLLDGRNRLQRASSSASNRRSRSTTATIRSASSSTATSIDAT